jgi:hypothetical protein
MSNEEFVFQHCQLLGKWRPFHQHDWFALRGGSNVRPEQLRVAVIGGSGKYDRLALNIGHIVVEPC